MVRSSVLLLLGVALAATSTAVDAVVVNSHVKRVIDLTRHVVRVQTDIAFTDADAATGDYSFALPKRQSARLAHVTAKCGKKAAICEVVRVDTDESSLVDQYAVVLKHAVPAGEAGHLKLTAYYTRVLTPFPAEITQTDDQLVLYEDAHLFTSPYRTETQTTKVKLPSGRIESYSEVAPTTHKGASITYGPYTDVAPFVAPGNTIRVHFKNHAPFLTVTTLVKEIEVSMWGRVSFEEVYDLLHTGARLTGGFSRFDYTVKGARGASFYELRAHLPQDAVNVYYRDQIGNVSTSRLRPTATRQELEFKPRFPIFGGWKSQWYLGYSVPTHSVLTRTSGKNRFKLEVDFSTSLEDAAVDDLTVKVILPEGSTNVEVNVPFAVDQQTRTTRQTYLDTPVFGRPVLVLQKANVVAHHNVPFEVTFDFEPTFMLHEPLLLVGAFLALFLFFMLAFRLDVSLVQTKTKAGKKETAKPKIE